jgi:fructose-1,6-bisphosphatase I
MAMLITGAGGRATNGERDIVNIDPVDLHETTPLFLGSPEQMDLVDEYLASDPEPLMVSAP